MFFRSPNGPVTFDPHSSLLPVHKELERLEKRLHHEATKTFPRNFTFRYIAGRHLRDLEGLSLALYCLSRDNSENIFLIWELRLFLLTELPKQGNILGCLVLECSSQKEGFYRLYNLDPIRWMTFFQRNFSQNLYSALRKIDISFPDSAPIVKPQRKRGYTDQGSLAPADKRARLDARNYTEDLKLEEDLLRSQRQFLDTLALIQGWSE